MFNVLPVLASCPGVVRPAPDRSVEGEGLIQVVGLTGSQAERGKEMSRYIFERGEKKQIDRVKKTFLFGGHCMWDSLKLNI